MDMLVGNGAQRNPTTAPMGVSPMAVFLYCLLSPVGRTIDC